MALNEENKMHFAFKQIKRKVVSRMFRFNQKAGEAMLRSEAAILMKMVIFANFRTMKTWSDFTK